MIAATLFSAAVASMATSQPPPGGEKGAKGKFKGPQEVKERPESLKVDLKEPPIGLVKNPRFFNKSADVKIPAHYSLAGDAAWVWTGTPGEDADSGIALYSGKDLNKDGQRFGSVTQRVTDFPGGVGKWFRFTFRGLAEPGFEVEKDALFMRVEYFGKKGTNPLDGVTQNIYPLVERDRKELAANGKFFKNGGAVWKTYLLEFRLPFAEIDTLDIGVGFKNGVAKAETGSEFFVAEFGLVPIPAPADAPKVIRTEKGPVPSLKSLISLGGRWFYDPEPGMKERPATLVVTAKNADRLYYVDGRLANPFAENMTAWLREGYLDLKGNRVEKDRFLPDNVVLEFKDGKEMVVHARNIPNHPTAIFPGRGAGPNFIQECDRTLLLAAGTGEEPEGGGDGQDELEPGAADGAGRIRDQRGGVLQPIRHGRDRSGQHPGSVLRPPGAEQHVPLPQVSGLREVAVRR
jgi:hypothetical protein